MLNTDRHSPNVKKRMTIDEFVRNNRGLPSTPHLKPQTINAQLLSMLFIGHQLYTSLHNYKTVQLVRQDYNFLYNRTTAYTTVQLTAYLFYRDHRPTTLGPP